MINGEKKRRVSMYLYIDHLGEGLGFTTPEDGESFVGIPHSWYAEGSEPFIEVHKNGVVVRTVNPRDLSTVEFVDEEEVMNDG